MLVAFYMVFVCPILRFSFFQYSHPSMTGDNFADDQRPLLELYESFESFVIHTIMADTLLIALSLHTYCDEMTAYHSLSHPTSAVVEAWASLEMFKTKWVALCPTLRSLACDG